MKVVFFGNHTVGVVALEALLGEIDVTGVVAHPEDPEDGQRYQSVFDFAREKNLPVIRGRGDDLPVEEFLGTSKPDLVWITDYRYLLPDSLLRIPACGGVNLHPSLLPRYRGRAPLNWAIINGETEIGLSAHFLSSEMDDGDIIAQQSFQLSQTEDVGDALQKLMPLYASLTRQVIRYFIDGTVPRKVQNDSLATVFPARKPEDGKINWRQSAGKIRDLVRAVAAPYPGAFTEVRDARLYIWKVDPEVDEAPTGHSPGSILSLSRNEFEVACQPGVLKVLDYTIESGGELTVEKGMQLN